ncbi:MAG: UAA transporter [Icmadophila ericetorum]|nr:UAA transporter [Icmadophila ericetorum]
MDVPHYPGGESATATAFQTRVGSPELRSTPAFSPESLAILHAVETYYENKYSKESPVGITDGSKSVATRTKVKHLATYFLFSLLLTLSNKAIMIEYPFPLLLTAIHIGISFIGTSVMLGNIREAYFTLRHIQGYDASLLNGFSTIYAVNIAVSNISLSMGDISVPLHQVIRATTPIFTVLIYRIYYRSTYSKEIYLSTIPVVLGVGFSTFGDYNATLLGVSVTFLGALLAAVKTIATNRLQTAGMYLSAVELLHRMSPMAFIQVVVFIFVSGEHKGYPMVILNSHDYGFHAANVLLINGLIAFGLNWVSFTTNRQVGALTMNVAGNIKQVLIVVLSVLFWQLKIRPVNLYGIVLTFLGGALYSYWSIPTRDENYDEDRKSSRCRSKVHNLIGKEGDAEYISSRDMARGDIDTGKRVRSEHYETVCPDSFDDLPLRRSPGTSGSIV